MTTWTGEIAPVPIEQVRMGQNGKMVTIEGDVGGVVEQLQAIDSRFHVRWSDAGKYFVVYTREKWQPEGSGHVVTYAQELDGRLVRKIEKIVWEWRQPGYSFADEMEKAQAKAEKEEDDAFNERIGESAEKLAWALRGELGLNDHRIFIPGGDDDE